MSDRGGVMGIETAEYIVTIDNPYYPEVAYCRTFEDAVAKRDEWRSSRTSPAGQYGCAITIAKLLEVIQVHVDY